MCAFLCIALTVLAKNSGQNPPEEGQNFCPPFKHQFSKSRPNSSKENCITTGSTNAQRCFLLSRANQLSFIIEGDTFFDEKPSLQTLVDDPDALRRHVQSCFRQDKSQLQLAVTYNASNMYHSSDAKKVRGSLPLPRCVRLPSLRAPSLSPRCVHPHRCAALSLSLAACVSPRCVHPPSAYSALYTMPSRYSEPGALAVVLDAHFEHSLHSGRL